MFYEYKYPLELVARSMQTRFQHGFARMAMHLLPRLDDVAYEPSSSGLKLLAEDESALATPAEILQQAYGDGVRLGPLRVRLLREAGQVKEPVMNVRVQSRRSDEQNVLDDLARRDAIIQEIDQQRAMCIVRAQATLRNLLGYRQTLATMTANTAEAWVWLSHYAPVNDEPDGGSAA